MEDNKKANHSISCTVTQCAHHACGCDYCSLDKISVGTHEKNPTACQCTDCESFVLSAKSSSCGGKDCK